MLTPKQFKQQVQHTFSNSWPIVIGYVIISTTIKTLGEHTKRKLMAKTIANEIESREWTLESKTETITEHNEDDNDGSILLDDLTSFTDTQGNQWAKDAFGNWVNLDA